MPVRSRIFAAAVLGLSLAQPLALLAADPPLNAPEPALLALEGSPSQARARDDQQIADAVADALKGAGLRFYRIDILARDGAVTLSGSVASLEQRADAVKAARAVSGVRSVVDRLALLAPSAIQQVQATQPPPLPAAPLLQPRGPDIAPAAPLVEPVPVFRAPFPTPYDLNPPPMPPYAWPTYAPHNNYSRVAYPLAYPYQAWPFIGPVYPFPKVPLGWRSVTLTWEDGHWWFSRTATKHDWWRLRYW
jgi:hypothetical protein